MLRFETALLRAVDQANAGVVARRHTPAEIAKSMRGRPLGSTKASPKVATGIGFDADVLAALKATGQRWQTRLNAIVRKSVLGQ
jgi:uncharacterized protein (DUF4415 family)